MVRKSGLGLAFAIVVSSVACSSEEPIVPAQSVLVGAWRAELPADIDRRLQQLAPQDLEGMRALLESFGYAYEFRADGTAERYVAGLAETECQSFRWRPLRETASRVEVELIEAGGAVQRTEFERQGAEFVVEKGRGAERRLRRQ